MCAVACFLDEDCDAFRMVSAVCVHYALFKMVVPAPAETLPSFDFYLRPSRQLEKGDDAKSRAKVQFNVSPSLAVYHLFLFNALSLDVVDVSDDPVISPAINPTPQFSGTYFPNR